MKDAAAKYRKPNRRGLAPLEMILVLPFLMMLMSMIIVFGYATTWKLRTETVARDTVWRVRWHRFANENVRPDEWPEPAQVSVVRFGEPPIEVYAGDPVLEDPIIAGPLPQIEVDDEVLDYTRGMMAGNASIIRSPPVFSTLVTFDFQVDHPIMDDRFQFHQMGISNYSRRIPVIWRTQMDDLQVSDEIQAAVSALENSPFRARLAALDNDSEFIAAWGWAPDFYPRARRFSSTDADWVRRRRLSPLVREIMELPFRLGNATIRLYQSQREEFPELQSTIDDIRYWLEGLRENRDSGSGDEGDDDGGGGPAEAPHD